MNRLSTAKQQLFASSEAGEPLLDDADRAALQAALAQSQADGDAGRLVDAADVLKRLRSS